MFIHFVKNNVNWLLSYPDNKLQHPEWKPGYIFLPPNALTNESHKEQPFSIINLRYTRHMHI